MNKSRTENAHNMYLEKGLGVIALKHQIKIALISLHLNLQEPAPS